MTGSFLGHDPASLPCLTDFSAAEFTE